MREGLEGKAQWLKLPGCLEAHTATTADSMQIQQQQSP